MAEAVHRLPGVTVANDQGEGRYVIIRGVDPRYANVTVNGQTAAAPEPDNRQVKLDDIPSSLIGQVSVIKSLTPTWTPRPSPARSTSSPCRPSIATGRSAAPAPCG